MGSGCTRPVGDSTRGAPSRIRPPTPRRQASLSRRVSGSTSLSGVSSAGSRRRSSQVHGTPSSASAASGPSGGLAFRGGDSTRRGSTASSSGSASFVGGRGSTGGVSTVPSGSASGSLAPVGLKAGGLAGASGQGLVAASGVSSSSGTQEDAACAVRSCCGPHHLKSGQLEGLSSGLSFQVRIYGMKARNLATSRACSATSLVVHWGCSLGKGATEPGLPSDGEERLEFHTKPVPGRAPKWLEVFSFRWTASSVEALEGLYAWFMVVEQTKEGPILLGTVKRRLLEVATGPVHHDVLLSDSAGADCGRLIADVRLQQICSLVVNPIEVLVHLHEAAPNDDFDGDDADANSAQSQTFNRTSPVERRLTFDGGAAREFRMGERERRQAAALASAAARKNRFDRENKAGTQSRTAEEKDKKEEEKEEEEDSKKRGAESARSESAYEEDGGAGLVLSDSMEAVSEDEPGPLVARWQLSFSATGVDNPNELFSTFTEMVGQPYWNTVDHSLLERRLDSTPATCNSSREGLDRAQPFDETTPAAAGCCTCEASNLKEGSLSSDGEARLRVAVSDEPQKSRTANSLGSEASERLSGELWSGPQKPSRCLSCTYGAKAPVDCVDRESTYRKLAALAGRGRLVKDVLYDDFPTLQLTTTIEELRQHHLRIRLHAKVFPGDSTKLWGECWLPFFKVYDSDVVTEITRTFYDSYFKEKLWLDGKAVGFLEGVIVFQNNPILRQVYAGVQTERGLCRVFPPVLGQEHRSVCFRFKGTSDDAVPASIQKIAAIHETMLMYMTSKAQHRTQEAAATFGGVGVIFANLRKANEVEEPARVQQELRRACEQQLSLLASSDASTRRSFFYSDEAALLSGQRVLLNLANHCLEFLEFTYWQTRGAYCAVLAAVLRRGELDIGSALPLRPDACKALTLSEVYVLYAAVKKLHREAEAALNSGSGCLYKSQRSLEGSQLASTGVASSGGGEASSTRGTLARSLAAGTSSGAREKGSESEGQARRSLGAALQRLRQASVGFVVGDAEAAEQLGREVRECRRRSSPEEGTSWKRCHIETVSEERKNALEAMARSLSAEGRFDVVVFHKRLKFCRQLRLLLFRLLQVTQRLLAGDASFGGQRRFACSLLAATYFLLPQFRAQLLAEVLTDEQREAAVDEWRGTEFDLSPESLRRNEVWNAKCPLRVSLDWTAFHRELEDYFGSAALKEDADAIACKEFAAPDWRGELGPGGASFFLFVEQWVRHVQQTGGGPLLLIEWREVPGYRVLLKRVLLDMKRTEVPKFPDSLLNCTGSLLANEKLLSVFVKIVFLKTSVHSTPDVFCALNYADFWAQLLASNNKQLPATFDFAFLRKGLEIVLGSDLYLNVAKVLWFVYKNLPVLRGEQLQEVLVDLCLKKHSRRLLFHWAWLVRRCFIWLLLYRLVEGTRKVVGRITGTEPPVVQMKRKTAKTSSSEKADFCSSALPFREVESHLPPLVVSSDFKCSSLSCEERAVLEGYVAMENLLAPFGRSGVLPEEASRVVKFAVSGCQAAAAEAASVSTGARYKYCNLADETPDAKVDSQNQQQQQQTGRGGGGGAIGGQDLAEELEEPSRVYVEKAFEELALETAAFAEWVQAGSAQLPLLVLPDAPLDAHTDVPLEA